MTRYKSVDGVISPFTAEEEAARDIQEKAWADSQADRNMALLRRERNRLLAETDYLALSDSTLTDAMKTYRKNLRDITKTATSLDDVSWPEKP